MTIIDFTGKAGLAKIKQALKRHTSDGDRFGVAPMPPEGSAKARRLAEKPGRAKLRVARADNLYRVHLQRNSKER